MCCALRRVYFEDEARQYLRSISPRVRVCVCAGGAGWEGVWAGARGGPDKKSVLRQVQDTLHLIDTPYTKTPSTAIATATRQLPTAAGIRISYLAVCIFADPVFSIWAHSRTGGLERAGGWGGAYGAPCRMGLTRAGPLRAG